jgi:hypothetical protein
LNQSAKGALSEDTNQVLIAARQMRAILDEMNNLVMLKADEMALKSQRVAMEDVIVYACEGLQEIALTRRQTLVYAFSEDAHMVNVDIDKTALALGNILGNAIRFSPEGSEISIGVTKEGEKVLAWVRDQGIGIPADQLRSIFDEFYQIEPPNTRHYGGLVDRSPGRKALGGVRRPGQRHNVQGVVTDGVNRKGDPIGEYRLISNKRLDGSPLPMKSKAPCLSTGASTIQLPNYRTT